MRVVTVSFKENIAIDHAPKNIGVVEDVQELKTNTFKIFAADQSQIREKIYDLSKSEKLTLLEMRSDELKLEDVFQRLTRK